MGFGVHAAAPSGQSGWLHYRGRCRPPLLLLRPLPLCLQVRHPGVLPFSALVAALMIIMAAVFVTQQGFMQGGSGGGAGGKRRPLRSTERED